MACTAVISIETPLLDMIKNTLSGRRYTHCLGVAELARSLCLRFGVNPEKGRIAGLAHDLARELPVQQLFAYASWNGQSPASYELERPILVHGRSAAGLLQQLFDFSDEEVLRAVEDHVVGRSGMPPLSKIIYVADYLEENRRFVSDNLRQMTLSSELDGMLLEVLRSILHYLKQQGKRVAVPALDL